MGSLSKYLANLAMKRGASIAVNACVDEILTDPLTKSVVGVKLANGQVID